LDLIEIKMPSNRLINELINEFKPRYLFPSIAAAIVVAAIEIVLAISYGALIFTGPLKENLSVGISLMLLSTTIYGILFALFSKLKGMISSLQDTAIAILATLTASITAGATILSPDQLLITIIAMIVLASIFSGLFFLIIGTLKLGRFVRYIPYPVIGGFLAGAGWLLATGSISMLTDIPVTIDSLPVIFSNDKLIQWIPGVLFGILVYGVTRKYDHYLIIPGLILAAIIGFYLVTGFGADNLEASVQRGLLYKSIGSKSLFQPVFLTELTRADFGAILHNLPGIFGVVVIGTILILLNITSLEISLQRDLDLNYELRLAGFSNLLAGLAGGVAGCHMLSGTILTHKVRANTRLTGILVALITAAVMLFGAVIITVIPIFVLGGLLFFIGLTFLVEWLWDSFRKFSLAEYMIIIVIVGFIATVGFLEGVAIGVLLSVVYFVVRYSKISIIRQEILGHQMRSTVQRPQDQWIELAKSEIKAATLKLQGFLFFGTANNLLEHARHLFESNVNYIILDFHRVTGFDSSAALSFIKLMQVATEKKRTIVFCCMNDATIKAFENSGFYFADFDCLLQFDDLDHSLEWYEESVLDEMGFGQSDKTITFEAELGKFGISREDAKILLSYTNTCEVKEKDILIRQGEKSSDMYYVESGRLTVELQADNGQSFRVSTLNPGGFFGEMSYYLKQGRSANIIADQDSKLLIFTEDILTRIEKDHPDIGVAFHKLMATSLSERLQHTDDTLRSMLL